jgi:Tol biopolymer transport system component
MLLSCLLLYLAPGEPTFDGTRFTPHKVAVSNGLGQLHIYEPSLKEPKYWAFKGHDVNEPSFSPDGKQIAYGDGTADQNIWVADAAGLNRRALSRGQAYDQEPTWSPNGKYILFVRQETGLMSVDVKTGRVAKVADGWSYAWSPNGTHLAVLRKNPKFRKAEENFERGEFSANDIWILGPDLKTRKQITRDSWYAGVEWLDDQTLWGQQVSSNGLDGGAYELRHFWIDVRSRNAKRIAIPAKALITVVSPDRRMVACCEEPSLLYIFDLRTRKRKTVDKQIYASDMLWTRDGKWLYFNKMSSQPKNMYADTQQVWRANTRTWKIEQISKQRNSYAYFLFDRTHSTVMFRTANGKLALSNSLHRELTLGSTYNVHGFAAWWGPPRKVK